MTEKTPPSDVAETSPQNPDHSPDMASHFEMRSGAYSSRFINIERRIAGDSAFPTEDDVFYASTPRPTHWSIAWSDLMMTMFVLFLCMFVYKAANEEFLGSKTPEVIGGDTTDALRTVNSGQASLPFSPIYPGVPLMTAGTVKKVEPATPEKTPAPPRDMLEEPVPIVKSAQPETAKPEPMSPPAQMASEPPPIPASKPDKVAIITSIPENKIAPVQATAIPPEEEEVQPRPLVAQETAAPAPPPEQDIYRLGKDAVESGDLAGFAAIDLVPDQTMRIILTSDLLFDLGRSELSAAAKNSLKRIGEVIQQTPYMINVVGHTDNIPMVSNRFSSNWELSVARASTVARFLINESGMNPNQFVVSGYSSYRPLVPNTTAANRARNRRVEIIISKKLPPPLPATAENLN